MKKILYIFLIVGFCSFLSSCDLDTAPSNAIEEEVAFETVENADKVLNGTWSYLWDSFFTYQNPGWTCVFRASDAMANDAVLQPGKYGYLSHYQFNIMNQSGQTSVRAVWTLAYKVIDNCNHIITKIDNLPSSTISDSDSDKDIKLKAARDRIKGQALALRGYIYLNLATFYQFSYEKDPNAKCVPIYTEPTAPGTKGKAKSSVKDVYDRATTDLTTAYTLLVAYERDETKKHKMDKRIVAGILARANLQKGNGFWDLAQTYANEAQNGISWMSHNDYLAGFNECNNVEWIWGHGQTADQKNASYTFNYIDVSSDVSGYYSFMADPYFKDHFDANDVRTKLFKWDVNRYKGGLMYDKFRFRSDGSETGDIVLMRKAEMILIEAEALAEQNQLTPAIDKLNELRMARGADTPNLSTLSKEDLIEVILLERRKELWGEGFGLSDILRRQKSVIRKAYPTKTPVIINGQPAIDDSNAPIYVQGHGTTAFPGRVPFTANSEFYLFTIPTLELTNNPNL